MCYVIAYDIPNDKRRKKVHKISLGYGKWTQYSLFECFLSKSDLLLLQAKLEQHLIAAEDSVRFYPLCATCVSKVETIGGLPLKKTFSSLYNKWCGVSPLSSTFSQWDRQMVFLLLKKENGFLRNRRKTDIACLENGGAELSLSHGSTSGWKPKVPPKAGFSISKTELFFGTSRKPLFKPASRAILKVPQAKWPVEPVGD